jgi:hypothetical protein
LNIGGIHPKRQIVYLKVGAPMRAEPSLKDARRAKCTFLSAVEQKVEECHVSMINHQWCGQGHAPEGTGRLSECAERTSATPEARKLLIAHQPKAHL